MEAISTDVIQIGVLVLGFTITIGTLVYNAGRQSQEMKTNTKAIQDLRADLKTVEGIALSHEGRLSLVEGIVKGGTS